jgi:hypothetical protein
LLVWLQLTEPLSKRDQEESIARSKCLDHPHTAFLTSEQNRKKK